MGLEGGRSRPTAPIISVVFLSLFLGIILIGLPSPSDGHVLEPRKSSCKHPTCKNARKGSPLLITKPGARPVIVNGCGPTKLGDLDVDKDTLTVRNAWFEECCNGHDRCFDSCDLEKDGDFDKCNKIFADCMKGKCAQIGKKQFKPPKPKDEDSDDSTLDSDGDDNVEKRRLERRVFGSVGSWFKDKANQVKDGLKSAGDKIKDGFKSAGNTIANFFSSSLKKLHKKEAALVKDLINGVDDVYDALNDEASKEICLQLGNVYAKLGEWPA